MNASDLLDPGLLAQLERLQLATRRRLAGRFSGEHRSPAFGASVDFSDYREYHPGDDFRRIDYPAVRPHRATCSSGCSRPRTT